jgi:hypothetical protein
MPVVAAPAMLSSGSLSSTEACTLLGEASTVEILRLIGSSSRGRFLEEENKPAKADLRLRLLEFGGMGVKEGKRVTSRLEKSSAT